MQKRKILFDNYDTAVDGLWTLAAWSLSDAEPRVNFIDVPGRLDGPLDASTALTGDIQYGPRTLEVLLESSEGTRLEREAHIDDIVNRLHGKRVKIWLPDDADHYLVGRLRVTKEYNTPAHAAVKVTGTCEPWKYENSEMFGVAWLCGKNIFDNQNLVSLARNYGEAEPIDTGVRCVIKIAHTSRHDCLRVAPVEHLVGQTITASYTATASGENTPRVCLGYCRADGSGSKMVASSVDYSGSVSMSVDQGALDNYDCVCMWLYCNHKGTAVVGDYIDYTNLQIELGAVATEYEAYTAGASSPVSVILAAARRPACPVIYVQGEVGVEYNGNRYTFGDGTYQLPDLQLTQSEHTVQVSGSGSVSFRYRRAVL